jgi:hypothetical protein
MQYKSNVVYLTSKTFGFDWSENWKTGPYHTFDPAPLTKEAVHAVYVGCTCAASGVGHAHFCPLGDGGPIEDTGLTKEAVHKVIAGLLMP